MTTVISLENISKYYRLGVIGSQTLTGDLNRWWARLRGKPDPYQIIGEDDHGNREDEFIFALRDVNLEVRQGEVLGIIGPNGAGKSTLLKILSRVTAPTSGQIKVKGRVASMLEVGTGFHPELTGHENIYLNGAILGMTPAEINRKYDEIVEFSGVGKFIDTPVKRYSSGMYVRLAFAVAAHLEPEILVVDEVLAVGDAEFQKKCLGKMGDVAEEGRTVLFVSHNMSAINRLCSRAILLETGRIVEDGPAVKVTGAYQSSVSGSRTIRSWSEANAPGTEQLKLLGVTLLVDGKAAPAMVEVQDSLALQLEYSVGEPELHFRSMVLLYTQGVLAFASGEPLEEARSSVGFYCSRVTIPPNLLSEDEYIVGISIFSSRSGRKDHFVKINDVLSFRVYDAMNGTSARGDYTQGLTGVVRPLLEWTKDFKVDGEYNGK